MSRRTANRQSFYAAQRMRRSRRRVWKGLKAAIYRGITLNFDKLHEQLRDELVFGSNWERAGKRIDPRDVYLPYTQGPERRAAQDAINRQRARALHQLYDRAAIASAPVVTVRTTVAEENRRALAAGLPYPPLVPFRPIQWDRGDGEGFTDKPIEPGEWPRAMIETATFTREQWEKAGKPTMRDGTPADPKDFGVVTFDLAAKGENDWAHVPAWPRVEKPNSDL